MTGSTGALRVRSGRDDSRRWINCILDPNVYAPLSARLQCGLHVRLYRFATLSLSLNRFSQIGWPVNHAPSLNSFAPILQGTNQPSSEPHSLTVNPSNTNTHHLCWECRFIFCSSIAATSCAGNVTKNNVVFEDLPRTEMSATAMGYAPAKWIVERMCARQ